MSEVVRLVGWTVLTAATVGYWMGAQPKPCLVLAVIGATTAVMARQWQGPS